MVMVMVGVCAHGYHGGWSDGGTGSYGGSWGNGGYGNVGMICSWLLVVG